MHVKEFLRYWREGCSQRHIARTLSVSRDTVARYVAAARDMGLEPDGLEPTSEQIGELTALGRTGPGDPKAPARDRLKPHLARIRSWLEIEKLTLVRIREKLTDHGCQVSESSLRRFVRANGLTVPRTTMRLAERPPGQAAEMDYGKLGRILDPDTGRERSVFALAVVLPYSRHMFLWPCFTQTLDDAIEGLERAWEFFEGLPRHLVIDNFPAAVAGVDRYRPRLTRDFMAYTRHRGLLVDAARPSSPRDKPVVERSIQYARARFFAGERFGSLRDLRARARQWCLEVAGQRVHGTTRRRPLEVFLEKEQPALRKWEGPRYEVVKSRNVKVHPDYHVRCEYALYSVPQDLVNPGAMVRVEQGRSLVRIFLEDSLIKVHQRQGEGGRSTDPQDLAEEMRTWARRDPETIRRQASDLGDSVSDYAAALLGADPTATMLRSGQRLIRLGQLYGRKALEDACRIALAADLVDVKRLEKILVKGLERQRLAEPDPAPPGTYALPGDVFAIGDEGEGEAR